MPRQPQQSNGRSNGHRRAVATLPRTRFLTIPLELRENIYTYLTDDESSESLLNLLEVNQQLFREAKPFLYKRKLIFEGQSELFTWLRRVGRDYLRHVADIGFQLHDIKPGEIVGALGKRLRQADRASTNGAKATMSDNPYHEACDDEVGRIAQAFSLMPNVKRLSIIPCSEGDPRPSYRMLISFSRMLARSFPNLHTLLNKESSLPINFVTNKPKLRRLQIPSRTPSSSAEVAAVFSALPITKLAIYGAEAPAVPSLPHRDVVAEMLRAVRPLDELTLYESEVKYSPSDAVHDALVKSPDAIGKHLQSLEALKVLVEYSEETPRAPATMAQLQRFLKFSTIERLEMAEPLIFALDHRLPSSIETFVIRLDRPDLDVELSERVDNLLGQFEKFTDELKRPGGARLPDLREVVIAFEADDDEDEIEDVEELDQAYAMFRGTGVTLRWVIGEPDHSL